MTRLALRLMRRRPRRSAIAGLAFAAMALPAAGVAAPYKDPVSPPASAYQVPSSFHSENASGSSASTSGYRLPSSFRAEATDGHAQQPVPERVTAQVRPSSFDWGDAGIGAASIVGLLALCAGMTLLVMRRRHGPAVA
jgi:hypothetical protein